MSVFFDSFKRKKNKVTEDKTSLESLSMEKGMRLMRDNRLRRLLDARHKVIPDELKQLGIEFPGKWFILILVNVSAKDKSNCAAVTDTTFGEHCLFIEEALNDGTMTPWVFTEEWDIYAIVNFNSETPELQRIKIIDLLEPIMPMLNPAGDASARAFVSKYTDNMFSISELHESVIFLRDYGNVLDDENVVMTYERLVALGANHEMNTDGLRGIEETQQFFSCIINADYQQAKRIFLGLIDFLLLDINIHIVPLGLANARLGYLINVLDMAVDTLRLRINPDAFAALFPRLDFRSCDNVQNFQEITVSIFDEVIGLVGDRSQKKSDTVSWVGDVKHFLDLNYSNVIVSLSYVAEEFHMNPAYMSRVFRAKVGSSIPNYINDLRLRKAKRLLESGNTVNDTAQLCGFGSVRTMSRIFQSKEHITPGKYRSNASNLHQVQN